MPDPTPIDRPITILHLGEGDHVFEVPATDAAGKLLRAPSQTQDRGDGRPVIILGAPQMERFRLAPRGEGGEPSRLALSQAEFDRLAKDKAMGPLLRDLVLGERPEVMILGAQIPAA